MVNHTRLDCVIGVTGQMRSAVSQALHHTQHRSAFGRRLVDQPLMANVLADLAIESEAATSTMLRLAGAYDRGESDFARIATAVGKYWICKRAPVVAAEALECLGGNGFVEEAPLARLFRESPLNGIWEGSGNVMCLDVLRAAGARARLGGRPAGRAGAGSGSGRTASTGPSPTSTPSWPTPRRVEARARRIVERAALVLPGLAAGAPLAPGGGPTPSAPAAWPATPASPSAPCPPGVDTAAIIARAWPVAA